MRPKPPPRALRYWRKVETPEMATQFDKIAATYDATWTNSKKGRLQRDIVWGEIDSLFQPREGVLDLGCGTGEDALHLMGKGVWVHAIDASAEMVRIARRRGVNAEVLRVEKITQLATVYDGALSNFGALNCVANLAHTGEQLARLLRAGAKLAICIMPPLCWPEVLRLNFRRWREHNSWHGQPVYYPSRREVLRAFPEFRLLRERSIAWGDHRLYIFERK